MRWGVGASDAHTVSVTSVHFEFTRFASGMHGVGHRLDRWTILSACLTLAVGSPAAVAEGALFQHMRDAGNRDMSVFDDDLPFDGTAWRVLSR